MFFAFCFNVVKYSKLCCTCKPFLEKIFFYWVFLFYSEPQEYGAANQQDSMNQTSRKGYYRHGTFVWTYNFIKMLVVKNKHTDIEYYIGQYAEQKVKFFFFHYQLSS